MQVILDFIVSYWYIVLPVLLILVVLVIILVRRGVVRRINLAGVELDFGESGIKGDAQHLFPKSDSAEFAMYFEQVIREACRIILIGTGLNILHRDPVFLELMERTKSGKCELEIYLANPYSPAIETRLIEEELGSIKPPVGKIGLVRRLETIVELQRSVGSNPNFTLKLFSNYPTFAMFIIDGEYFIYPYGYALLGNLSPIAHYSKSNKNHQPMTDFLDHQYHRVKSASVDAGLVLDLHQGKATHLRNLIPAAVYIVPPAPSPLYQFGSKVLGYDVRERRHLLSSWADYTGSAADFGFHLTIADALYYTNAREVELLGKEIEFIVVEFNPFILHYELQKGFPNERSIALVCRDESGTLEALHHELVFRCYRMAAASNYTLGIAKLDRDENTQRAQLMIQRYHAPYIFNLYQPHFTLLTDVPVEQMDQVYQEIEQAFQEGVPNRQMEARSLALMTRPLLERPWEIIKEIRLG